MVLINRDSVVLTLPCRQPVFRLLVSVDIYLRQLVGEKFTSPHDIAIPICRNAARSFFKRRSSIGSEIYARKYLPIFVVSFYVCPEGQGQYIDPAGLRIHDRQLIPAWLCH